MQKVPLEYMEITRRNMRSYLATNGISLAQMGALANISGSALHQLLRDGSQVSISTYTVACFARAIKVPPATLYATDRQDLFPESVPQYCHNTLCTNIEAYLLKHHLNAFELSIKCGLGKNTIHRLTKGDRGTAPQAPTLHKIAEGMGITVYKLVTKPTR